MSGLNKRQHLYLDLSLSVGDFQTKKLHVEDNTNCDQSIRAFSDAAENTICASEGHSLGHHKIVNEADVLNSSIESHVDRIQDSISMNGLNYHLKSTSCRAPFIGELHDVEEKPFANVSMTSSSQLLKSKQANMCNETVAFDVCSAVHTSESSTTGDAECSSSPALTQNQISLDRRNKLLEPGIASTSELDHSFQTFETRIYSCPYCDRKFTSSQALGGHQNAHKRERTAARMAQKINSASGYKSLPQVYLHAPNLLDSESSIINRSLCIRAHSAIHTGTYPPLLGNTLSSNANPLSSGHHGWSKTSITMQPGVGCFPVNMFPTSGSNESGAKFSGYHQFSGSRTFSSSFQEEMLINNKWPRSFHHERNEQPNVHKVSTPADKFTFSLPQRSIHGACFSDSVRCDDNFGKNSEEVDLSLHL